MNFSRSSSPLSRRLSFLERKLAALSADWQVNFLMEGNSLLGLRPGKGTSIGLSFITDLSGWQQFTQEDSSIAPAEAEGGAFDFSARAVGSIGIAEISAGASDASLAPGSGSRLFVPSGGFYMAFRYQAIAPFPAVSRGFSVGGSSDQGGFQLIYVGRDEGYGPGDTLIIQVLGPSGFAAADTGVLVDGLTHDVEMWSVDGVNLQLRIDGKMIGAFAPTALPVVPLSPIVFGALATSAATANVNRFSEYLAIGRVGG